MNSAKAATTAKTTGNTPVGMLILDAVLDGYLTHGGIYARKASRAFQSPDGNKVQSLNGFRTQQQTIRTAYTFAGLCICIEICIALILLSSRAHICLQQGHSSMQAGKT